MPLFVVFILHFYVAMYYKAYMTHIPFYPYNAVLHYSPH